MPGVARLGHRQECGLVEEVAGFEDADEVFGTGLCDGEGLHLAAVHDVRCETAAGERRSSLAVVMPGPSDGSVSATLVIG